ncbi:MAG: hypothetical protein ACSLE4_11115 [Methyloceanibacter sp.]|uniref:hypothetical protein n=1 Tax=Methyloceanibacter sp. TaxID=1965321 RepID=UPI003EE2873E
MLNQLTVPILGLAVLAATAVPAAADRGRTRFIEPLPQYAYDAQPPKGAVTTSQPRKYKRKFDPKLDFETEAVWRNLRPEWFVGGR